MTSFTYEPDAQPFQAMSLTDPSRIGPRYRARVRRSDGAIVWQDGAYRTSRDAKAQAGRVAAKYRAYLERENACFHDRETAAKAWTTAHRKVRKDTAAELCNAANQGASAAYEQTPEDEGLIAAGYSADTAQGITWTQAYRLTKDRLSDWADENPTPEQP